MNELEKRVEEIKRECNRFHEPTGICFAQNGIQCPYQTQLRNKQIPLCEIYKELKAREND